MIPFIYIAMGLLFSCASGYITWLSWRDTRRVYSVIAKLESRIQNLEDLHNSDKPLHS